VRVNPADAKQLKINDGDIVQVSSRRGKVNVKASITDDVAKGVVFMTFHYAECVTNTITNPALDPVSKIPELKVCAVRVDKT